MRRAGIVALLCVLLLAAVPTPASARPWTNFAEVGNAVDHYLPLALWLARVFVSRIGVTNVSMNESGKILP